jgi:hypothetical protein
MAQKQSNNRKAPLIPTAEEIKELAANRELTELWSDNGTQEDMEAILHGFYVVKFNFVNAFPGYCGELFVIQPDYLAEEVPAVRVIRGKNRQLVVVPQEIKKGVWV